MDVSPSGMILIRRHSPSESPKTFPWGKGDRREAVVDEGVTFAMQKSPGASRKDFVARNRNCFAM
jgi:hypothetical protein